MDARTNAALSSPAMAAHPLLCIWIAAAVATPAPEYTRAAAIRLYSAGQLVPAAEHMREVYRRPGAPVEERRAAAAFVVGAYRAAFEAADDRPSAAAYLCDALAVAEDFKQTAGAAAASLTRAHEELARLRAPFGPCDAEPASAPDDAPADKIGAPQPASAAVTSPPEWLPISPGRAGSAAALPPPSRPEPVNDDRPRRSPLAWAGVALLGAGAATTAASLGVGISQARTAMDRSEALKASAASRPYTQQELGVLKAEDRDLRQAARILGIGLGVGAVLIIVGATLTAVGVRNARSSRVRIALQPKLHGASIALRWNF